MIQARFCPEARAAEVVLPGELTTPAVALMFVAAFVSAEDGLDNDNIDMEFGSILNARLPRRVVGAGGAGNRNSFFSTSRGPAEALAFSALHLQNREPILEQTPGFPSQTDELGFPSFLVQTGRSQDDLSRGFYNFFHACGSLNLILRTSSISERLESLGMPFPFR